MRHGGEAGNLLLLTTEVNGDRTGIVKCTGPDHREEGGGTAGGM